MGYKNVKRILPDELILQIQEFVDGELIYVPRKSDKRRCWGDNTSTKDQLKVRDLEILYKYNSGIKVCDLADKYHMSNQGIYKILSKQRNK